jgi:hypothetical protein
MAGRIAFEPPADSGAQEAIKRELRKCRDKHHDYVLLTLQPPKRPRTTGKGSQNHHLNGHIIQICNETGNSYDAIKYCVKMLAVEEMGYPYEIIDGHIWPKAEHESSTDECAKLIEAAHVWAAQHGIILQE